MAVPDRHLGAITVVEERELAEELDRRRAGGGSVWPVPVTDLLDPRPAFFRRFASVPLPPARRVSRGLGTLRHSRWLRTLGPPERVEARVQRGGLVGVIDLREDDGPTELKTTARAPSPGRWVEERGGYFDQLGIYAALTDASHGRLVIAGTEEPLPPDAVAVVRCRFDDPGALLEDAGKRADRFRRALRSGDPSELPRCLWFGRNCPYQQAGACDCRGSEPADDRWVRDRIRDAAADEAATDRWRAGIRAAERLPPPVLLGFADLVYPRRAFFERTDPAGAAEGTPIDRASQEAYRALVAAIDSGPAGERSQRGTAQGEPPGTVGLFRELPYLVKTRRGFPPAEPMPLDALSPHYLEELGFRCAASATSSGWIFLDYLGARSPARRIRVVRLRFEDPSAWREELDRRRGALAEALRSGDPTALPACPAWRFDDCDYRAVCGCASTPS